MQSRIAHFEERPDRKEERRSIRRKKRKRKSISHADRRELAQMEKAVAGRKHAMGEFLKLPHV